MTEVVDAMLQALGDLEFVVVRLDDDHLSRNLLEALLRQVESGGLRLVDVLVLRRTDDGRAELTEIDRDDFALAGLGLDLPGLICEDDAHHFASAIAAGSCAALLLVEPTWVERLSHDIDHREDRVLTTQTIPAPVANASLALALRRL